LQPHLLRPLLACEFAKATVSPDKFLFANPFSMSALAIMREWKTILAPTGKLFCTLVMPFGI
jgi:hypothetical protein